VNLWDGNGGAVLAVGTTAFFLFHFQFVNSIMQSFSLGITSSGYKQNSTAIDLVLNKVEQTAVALDVCSRYGRFRLGSRFMLAHAASQLELGAIRLR
jgi:hypothetical protein